MKAPRRARAKAEPPALPSLEKLASAPLANPVGIFMPGGKRRLKRAKVTPPPQLALFDTLPAMPKRPRKAKLAAELITKAATMLDHYARVDVPLCDVAEYCLLSIDQTVAELAKRGRLFSVDEERAAHAEHNRREAAREQAKAERAEEMAARRERGR